MHTLLLLFSLLSFAKNTDIFTVKLFEVDANQGVETHPPYKSNRVHQVYDNQKKEWKFVKTDSSGLISTPREYLRTGTLLPGLNLGSSDVLKNFELKENGTWEPTLRDISSKPEGIPAPMPPVPKEQ